MIFAPGGDVPIRILLSNIPAPRGARRQRFMPKYPPLALAYMAAALRAAGAEVRVVDSETTSEDAFLSAAREWSPHMVGLSATMPMLRPTLERAASLRKVVPRAFLVVGGPLTQVFAERLVGPGAFDAAVRGEAEHLAPELVARVREGGPYPFDPPLPGMTAMTASGIRTEPPVAPVADLDCLPLPAWDLLPRASRLMRHPLAWTDGPASAMITSRGCVFRCSFCYQYPFKTFYRHHSVTRVVEEARLLRNVYGVKHLRFLDDLFTLDRAHVLSLCEALARDLPDMTWHCNTRSDLLDPELLRAMARAGCRVINLGLESGDADDLRRLNKRPRRDPRSVIEECRAAGIDVIGQFILGFPWDTRRHLTKRLGFALSLPLRAASFWPLIPFPGTPLYDEALSRHGEFDALFVEHVGINDPGPLFRPVYSPPGMTRAELGFWCVLAQAAFHAKPGVLKSQISSLLSARRWKR
jgi:anaerobic magnesium-protoporphyrin IX monomethyl ester cyclase